MFCVNCGKQINDTADFCTYCGSKQPDVRTVAQDIQGKIYYANQQPQYQQQYEQQYQNLQQDNESDELPDYINNNYQNQGGFEIPNYDNENHWAQYPVGYTGQQQYIGFSEKIYSPEFKAAIKHSKKSSVGCAAIIIPIPLIIYIIAYFVSDEISFADMVVIGGGVSLLLLMIALISTVVKASKKTWDGTVVSKDHKITKQRKKDGNGGYYIAETYWDIVRIRKDNGKIHEICEESWGNSYGYFNIGDRVRFHPDLGIEYPYEKFDKSRDKFTICMFCKRKMKMSLDNCDYCGSPLLK